jgi:hypothetical protein
MIDDNKKSPKNANVSIPPASLDSSLILRTSDPLPGDVLLYRPRRQSVVRKKDHLRLTAYTRMSQFISAETLLLSQLHGLV